MGMEEGNKNNNYDVRSECTNELERAQTIVADRKYNIGKPLKLMCTSESGKNKPETVDTQKSARSRTHKTHSASMCER